MTVANLPAERLTRALATVGELRVSKRHQGSCQSSRHIQKDKTEQ